MSNIMYDYSKEVSNYSVLTKEEELKLFQIISKSKIDPSLSSLAEEARLKIINSNLRLVLQEAYRYKTSNVSLEDIIQAGNMGLITAVDNFDLSKGCCLSTSAVLWIRQSIRKLVYEDGTIRIPYNQSQDLAKVNKVISNHLSLEGTYPSFETISKETGFDVDRIKTLQSYQYGYSSIDEELEDGRMVSEIIPSDSLSPIEAKELSSQKMMLEEALKKLPPIKREAVSLRYGLIDGIEWTFDAIAKRIGKSRERTRQLIIESISDIKALCNI